MSSWVIVGDLSFCVFGILCEYQGAVYVLGVSDGIHRFRGCKGFSAPTPVSLKVHGATKCISLQVCSLC